MISGWWLSLLHIILTSVNSQLISPTQFLDLKTLRKAKTLKEHTLVLMSLSLPIFYVKVVYKLYYIPCNEVVGGYTGFTMSICL